MEYQNPVKDHARAAAVRSWPLWDACVRLCHFSMIVLFALLWWSGENHAMTIHNLSGYVLLAVVLLRIYWGFAGSNTARFSGFVRQPAEVWTYLANLRKKNAAVSIGHNPLGGYSVIALLLLIVMQIMLGFCAIDVDGFEGGPFADYLSFKLSRKMAHWHALGFNLMLFMVILHVAAIAYYRLWRQQDLIMPMVTGKSSLADQYTLRKASVWRLLAGLAGVIAIVWLIVK